MTARRSLGLGHDAEREGGQVLVLFALVLTGILIALALLFDGAQSLVTRRQLQNTADAAALAGANIVQATGGCTAALVSKTGTGNTIYVKVRQAVMDNLNVSSARADALLTKSDGSNGVECATDQSWYLGYAVKVTMLTTNPTYFGSFAGVSNIGVGVTATAFNGPVNGGKFSVVMLDPCHNGTDRSTYATGRLCDPGAWTAQRNGCPSIQFNGGPTVIFEGSLQSNSACRYDTALNFTGAVGTSGSGNASITLANTSSGQATIRMVGSYNPSGFSNISPIGQIYTFQEPVPDTLAGLLAPSTSGWLTCPSSSSLCPGAGNNRITGCFVLSPGVYTNGIDVGSSAEVYMKPGLYVMKGGGIGFSGQGKLYSISSNSSYPAGSCSTFSPETLITSGGVTATNWELNLCKQADGDPPSGTTDACGVMIYNICGAANPSTSTCTQNGSNPVFGPVSLNGGNALRLRAFCASAATSTAATCTDTRFAPQAQQDSSTASAIPIKRYRNIVFWQSSTPGPTSAYTQPDVTLAGSGNLFLQGTVYAPRAFVKLTGNCGGSGGSEIDLTLQFISYDLQVSGSCTYRFLYRVNSFATPSGYGLVR